MEKAFIEMVEKLRKERGDSILMEIEAYIGELLREEMLESVEKVLTTKMIV